MVAAALAAVRALALAVVVTELLTFSVFLCYPSSCWCCYIAGGGGDALRSVLLVQLLMMLWLLFDAVYSCPSVVDTGVVRSLIRTPFVGLVFTAR